MPLARTSAALRRALGRARAAGSSVGLVPTMGALHAGHRALLERAVADGHHVVLTIFVNPLQFDDGEDLAAYPRDLEADVTVAEASGVTAVFAPSVAEMYPDHPRPPAATVHVTGPAEGFEGVARPGHFDGVATVVTKLLATAGACQAYFGEKDAQQLAVVRRIVEDLSLPARIVGCPTVRDADGLALSSRNARLTAEARAAAPSLHRALGEGVTVVAEGASDPLVVHEAMARVVGAEPLVEPIYAEVVDPVTFRVPTVIAGPVRLVIAAFVGGVRLIDNMAADPPG